MKIEELKKIINRFPIKKIPFVVDEPCRFHTGYFLSVNGRMYDVYSSDERTIDYHARGVDEHTACNVFLTCYKDYCTAWISANYKSYEYYKNIIDCRCLFAQERSLESNPLEMVRESEYLDVINIDNQSYTDTNLKVVFNRVPYNTYGFCNVKIYRDETTIWSGGNALYIQPRMGTPIISSKYNNAMLIQAAPTGYSVKPVIVDLVSGDLTYLYTEENLVGIGDIGLLYSSNVAFYNDHRLHKYRFYDISTMRELPTNILDNALSLAYKWSVCPVPDCILLLTLETENNLILYNVRKCEVVRVGTFPVEKDKKYDFGMWFDKEKKRVIIKSFCPTEPLGKDVQCYSVYFDGPVSN